MRQNKFLCQAEKKKEKQNGHSQAQEAFEKEQT
jgi:hypothetical protein